MHATLLLSQALELLKVSINELYSKKGPEVVKANLKAVDGAEAGLRKIEVPESWANVSDVSVPKRELFHHVNVPDGVNKCVCGAFPVALSRFICVRVHSLLLRKGCS